MRNFRVINSSSFEATRAPGRVADLCLVRVHFPRVTVGILLIVMSSYVVARLAHTDGAISVPARP